MNTQYSPGIYPTDVRPSGAVRAAFDQPHMSNLPQADSPDPRRAPISPVRGSLLMNSPAGNQADST
ncbi:hypothetical protein [Corynebacterium sp.]|uniref:hypothetical protein n=1 Tax=Corynebacterium sp. TaxID=1720 RepID=UPI0026DD3088|nr:hypothetical protein [Corynebacterium sp.]MDO5076214.1 hypothetical protein [Corynebacterium sp.]